MVQVTKHGAQEGVEEPHIEDAAHQAPVGQRLGIPRAAQPSGRTGRTGQNRQQGTEKLENMWDLPQINLIYGTN